MKVDVGREIGTKGFSEEALLQLSAARSEPDWLLQRRLDAWRAYSVMPVPSRKEEEWRRTDLSSLDLNEIAPVAPMGGNGLPQDIAGLGVGEESAGLLVHADSALATTGLTEALAARGVIFGDLGQAARENEGIVRKHLNSLVPPDSGKYAALNGAFWTGGSFLYVPRGLEVALPFQAFTWATGPGYAVMPRTLVVAEEGASVTLIDEYASADHEAIGMANGVVELVVGRGASVRYVALQRWGRNMFNLSFNRGAVARDGQLTTMSVVLGSRITKSWVESLLREPGASTNMMGVMFPDGTQRFHHHTLQDHQSPDTTSDLLYKAVLDGKARSEYSGLIRVHKDAQRTNAYQANRNLSLSQNARADSMPKLEIEANDVRCTHGATVGPIDPEQVFYLMARGLPRNEAQRIIVEGFFTPVVERIPLESVQRRIWDALAAKLSS